MILDAAWVDGVCRACDPVFAAADVGFTHQALDDALLWEADPRRFAERYPDSGIVETYGEEQWPNVHCIDWWAYLEPASARIRISVEGWNLPELHLPIRGHAGWDGAHLADLFARLLGVRSPRL